MSGLGVFIIILASLVNRNAGWIISDDRFMSMVNLEHYYVIEENVLSNADVLLRDDYFGAEEEEEEEEEHLKHAPNLTLFKSVIDETKTVHRLAGPDLEKYLANPVNVFHLFRRLDSGWRDGLDLLLQTKPCRRWNVPSMAGRLQYLKTKLPGKTEMKRVVEYIATLQKLYKLNANDIVKGRIGVATSLKPLNLDEQFDIVKIFHDRDDMQIALEWLNYILKLLISYNSTQSGQLGFKVTDVLNLMASAHYHMKNIPDALKVTEKVLQLDPSNMIAENNLNFFKRKLKALEENSEDEKRLTAPPTEELSKYEKLCARRKRKALKKKCWVARAGLTFFKVEPIRDRPYVVMVHDVIPKNTAENLKKYAYETQTNSAWYREEVYYPPKFNIGLESSAVKGKLVKLYFRQVTRSLELLSTALNRRTLSWRKLHLANIGQHGMHLEKYKNLLELKTEKEFKRKEVGAYFIFLNEVKKGGQVVLTDHNISVHPEQGSVLFYLPSQSKMQSFCPVVGEFLWVAVQPVVEVAKDFCVDADEWL